MKKIITKYKFLLMTITVFFAGTIAVGAQAWNAAASVAEIRKRHSATLLLNGKVLLSGGEGSSAADLLSNCELYDPITNAWSSASTTSPRILPTTTLLPNGKVLVAGGIGSSSCELYDPVANSWSPVASMGNERSGHTATLLVNGKVLVTGGRGLGFFISSCELYDPISDTWSPGASMAIERLGHTATLLLNGKVLVVGGTNANGSIEACELYDPATNTWSTVAPLAGRHRFHGATLLLNGKVLVSGGQVTSGQGVPATSSCVLYDPITNIWSTTGSMAGKRYLHTATLLSDGKVMVAGGEDTGVFLNSCELYDSATGIWGATATMAGIRSEHTATLLSNNQVLVIGGNNVGIVLSSCELYDPSGCTPPVFSVCPTNINVNGVPVIYTASALGTPSTLTYSLDGATIASGIGTGSGSSFNVGITNVIITATNACGSATCSFTVTATDNPPTIVCPSEITVNNDVGGCEAKVDFLSKMFAANGGAVRGADDAGALMTVDKSTAASMVVGTPIQGRSITGIDFSSTGTLFGIKATNNFTPTELITINPATGGLISNIGTVTLDGILITMTDMAIQPGTNIIYGTTNLNQLVTVNADTATATLIGQPAPVSPGDWMPIAFAPDGTLYGVQTGYLLTIDPLNGTVLTKKQINLGIDPLGLGVDPITGLVYANASGDEAGQLGNLLYSINPVTGFTALIGFFGGTRSIQDIAFKQNILVTGVPLSAISFSKASGTSFLLGSTTVTATATNIYGTATCTFNVTVSEMEKPTFSCPADRNIDLTSSCTLVVPDLLLGLTGSDNCGTVTFTQNPPATSIFPSSHNQTQEVYIFADDGNGNINQCTVVLTSKDVTKPVIFCSHNRPSSRNSNKGSCFYEISGKEFDATVDDNCASVNLSWSVTGATTINGNTSMAGVSLNAGLNTITWTATDLGGNTDTCSITVTVKTIVNPITGDSSVCKGSVITLSDIILGGTWSSSNTSIATVEAGIVTGIAAGSATISYILACGTVTKKITVNDIPVVASITGTSSVNKGSSIILSDATAGGTWSSGDTSVATVNNNGKVTGKQVGTVAISYAITNSSGCTTTVTKSIDVISVAKTIETEEITTEIIPFNVTVYPNPSNHQFTLSIEGGSYQKTEVMIYDILGRLVNHIEADALPILLGKELTAGHYFAIVKQGNNQQTVRLIKRQ